MRFHDVNTLGNQGTRVREENLTLEVRHAPGHWPPPGQHPHGLAGWPGWGTALRVPYLFPIIQSSPSPDAPLCVSLDPVMGIWVAFALRPPDLSG